jgi:very-short-patch-repair endonuclease
MSTNRPGRKLFDRVKHRAKELRKTQTKVEQVLWARLRNRGLHGLKFRRQHPIGPYIADFYCAEHRLIVEVDGGIHNAQQEPDKLRGEQLAAHGYRVVRFTNAEVETSLQAVLERIAAACGMQRPSPEPGEGQADVRQRGGNS